MYGQETDVALDGEVAAVLPARWGRDPVSLVLERLFAERYYPPSELVSCRQSGPYTAEPYEVLLHDDATQAAT
jgi:hypothetical protein